jgi:large subunit ribosomal protein L9
MAKQRNQILKGKHGGMQLVLTEDVPHLGKQGDVVEVKPGYGRNYLLPRGMATALAEQIAKMAGITIEANANDEGHLYGSVAAPEIAKGLKAQGMLVEPDMVKLEGPIKETGLYAVKLNLGYEIETEVKVAVAPIKAQK